MKQILLLVSIFICVFSNAQELPSVPANGFAFPIGTKFTIKLEPINSKQFNFSVIEFEPFQEIIDTWDNDSLFTDKGENNTIVAYFCLGTHGDTDAEKEKNMKVLLLFKNYSEFALKYSSDIQRKEDDNYESTSNVGMYPGAKGTEMWPYMIYSIGLHSFEELK